MEVTPCHVEGKGRYPTSTYISRHKALFWKSKQLSLEQVLSLGSSVRDSLWQWAAKPCAETLAPFETLERGQFLKVVESD